MNDAIQIELLEQLQHYQIDSQRYCQEKAQLLALGFDAKQADDMILRAHSELLVAVVREQFQHFSYFQLTPANIVALIGQLKKAEAIEQMLAQCFALHAYGCSSQQLAIWVQAQYFEGMSELLQYIHILEQQQFDAQDIRTILAQQNCETIIHCIINQAVLCTQLKIYPKHIIRLITQPGGSNNLVVLLNNLAILQTFGLQTHQVVSMMTYPNGAQNIVAFAKSVAVLRELQLSPEQIMDMACDAHAAQIITAIGDSLPVLQNFATETGAATPNLE